jgi:Transglycosylase SLT domain
MRSARATVIGLLFMWVSPAHAELVYFQTGRAFSVRAIRSDGEQLVLHLRGGGEVTCAREIIVKVEPDEVEYPEVLAATPVRRRHSNHPPFQAVFGQLVATTAAKYEVSANLVHALIEVESGYRTLARSPKGARGLMQVLPSTGRQYGALDLFDPKVNVDAGVRHLKSLLRRFELPVALAAYNAGEGAVARFGGIPPFRETRNYVSRILNRLKRSQSPPFPKAG